ncbi:MAG: hypothetical protein IT193_12185 [Propionibacteriaceae bacterium]|nr:hypothetical protein [Propionibacteriaceae bacterium]
MDWWQFLIPVIVIALVVRLEALLIGPYWSWLEMFPYMLGQADEAKVRRASLWRRVAVPGITSFVLFTFWPTDYGLWDAPILGAFGGLLTLWSLVYSGPPLGVTAIRGFLLYASMVGSFSASALLGAHIAQFARSQGGVWQYLQDNLFGIIIGAVLTTFMTGITSRVSASLARDSENA